MSELKKEQYALSDEDLKQVSGGMGELHGDGWTILDTYPGHCQYCNEDVDGNTFKEEPYTVFCSKCHRAIGVAL